MHKMPLSESVLFGANFVLAFTLPFDGVSILNIVASAISLVAMSLYL